MAYTTIDDPSSVFQCALYSGNAGTQSITNDGGSDLQPDMVWIKCRSGTHATENHNLFDVVRGATKFLIPNGTTASTTDTNSLTAFNTDGFSLGTRTDVNGSGAYVGWQWKAGNSSGSTNSDGSLSTTVSVNTTAGFSIVKWTGADRTDSLGHGLGAVPKMIIAKRLATRAWTVYHEKVGADKKLVLNTTAAESSSSDFDATPTSSVINVGYTDDINGSGADYIAYCWAEKKGYSKIGSYIANGDASGGFVYTGFKIGWLMIKRTDDAAGWIIYDFKREGRNTENDYLLASSSSGEGANNEIDLYSNGFKPREASRNELNVSGASYVYMCFAESPFVNSKGVPTNAR